MTIKAKKLLIDNTLGLFAATLCSALILAGNVLVYAAGPATLYLTSTNDSVTVGQQFTISLKLNTNGATANGVDLTVTYDAAKVTADAAKLKDKAIFDFNDTNSVANGTIRYIAAAVSNDPTNGDVELANVSFTAKQTGSVTFNYSANSVVKDGTLQDITGTRLSKTVTITATTPPPPTDPPPTTPKPTQPTPTPSTPKPATPAPAPKDTTAPVIDSIEVTGSDNREPVLTWTSNEDTTALVEYGPNQDNLILVASETTPTKTHRVALSVKDLDGYNMFYYRITITDASGNIAVSEVKSAVLGATMPAAPPVGLDTGTAGKGKGLFVAGSIGTVVLIIAGGVGYFLIKKRGLDAQNSLYGDADMASASVNNMPPANLQYQNGSWQISQPQQVQPQTQPQQPAPQQVIQPTNIPVQNQPPSPVNQQQAPDTRVYQPQVIQPNQPAPSDKPRN